MSEIISKITMADIARALHITPATVSRALNDHPAIKEATKKAVKEAAQRLHYQPNKIASSLRRGKSNIIGVLIPSAAIHFFGSIVHGIEKVASRHHFNVLIYQTNESYENEKRGIQTFLQSQVDGILASISKETINLDHYFEIKKRGIPLVLFDRVTEALDVAAVVVNDYLGAFEATKHLVSQGCRRIAHIGGQQHVTIFNQRLKGYIDALNVHHIPVDEDLIIYGKVSMESGRSCMKRLLELTPGPDAVFAVEDYTALGAIQAIKEAHKTIPGDIAVIGFANEPFGEYITPSLSTVHQQTGHMGEVAASLFLESYAQKGGVLTIPKKQVLEPQLIYRQSSLKFPV